MQRDAPSSSPRYPTWVRIALWQGIVAQIVFALTVSIGGALRPGYSHVSQAISELTEIGAPNKALLDPALLLMEIMGIAFGIGYFWAVRDRGRMLKTSATLVAIIGVVGTFFYVFPMDPVGDEMSFSGQMHLGIVTVSAIAALLAVAFAGIGWARIRPRLARLSWVLLVVMIVGGIMAIPVSLYGWPGIGLWQRGNTAAFALWQIMTAVALLRNGGFRTRKA